MLARQNAIVNKIISILSLNLDRLFLYWPTLKNLIFLGEIDSKAEVAKLVDALDSESSPVKGVGVRVPSSAPSYALALCAIAT